MDDISVLNLFIEAGLVVKLVMIILLIASLLTWIVIFERYNFFRDLKKTNSDFLKTFWSGGDLNKLYAKTENSKNVEFGVTNVFKNAFKEFNQLKLDRSINEFDLESINRAMRVSITADEEVMSKHLSFLANVGSVSCLLYTSDACRRRG